MSDAAAATAREIIARLGLAPHPEGGWYRRIFEDEAVDETGRARCTLIYYLLAQGETSAWHRVDATEIWLWHAGAPLALTTARDLGGPAETVTLGADLAAGARPHAIVPARLWQTAVGLGDWTLVSCVVAPGFRFEGFELAGR